MAIEVVGTRNNGARLALACLSGDKADLLGWAVEKSLWTGSTAYCMDTGESLVYDRASGAWWPVSTGGGGGGDVTVEQNKAVSITKQDATEVTPSVGYNAMAKVTATPVLQEKTAASNGDIEPDAGYAGLKKVTVAVPAAPEGQTKDVRITQNGVSSVSPDNGFVLNQVNIETDVAPNLQNKTITQNGRYVADDEYDGLGEVTVDVAGGGALEENKEVTITENGTTEIVPTGASESCYTDFTRRYNEDGSVSQSSIPAGTVESQNQIGSMYTANGVNYTSGGEGLYLYYFQIEDAATHETLALPANAKKSSRIGANAISGGEEQYDMDVENGYTIACYDGVLYLKNGDDYYFNFDFSISNWNDLYYAFFNVGIGGTKVTDAALIAALNAVTFAASIKLYSLYGEFFYPVTGFTQFSIEYDSDKDAAGSIWEYGDTNNQYPYIVRYDKIGTFLFLSEAQPTDIYYATYKGIRMYDGMEKVTATVAIPLEENKAVEITENGTVEIEPSSGKTAMEKVTATVAIPLEENKAVEITENGTVEIEPSSGKTAMEKVTATVAIPFILYGFLWDSAVLLAKQLVRKPGTYDVLKNNEAVQMAVDSDLSLANTAKVSILEGKYVGGKYGTKYINDKFFICTSGGLFVSQDGASWTQVHTEIVYDIIYFKGNYYEVRDESSENVLYKSADLNTWEKLTDAGKRLTDVLASDGNVLFFGKKYSFDGEVWADCQGMRSSDFVMYLPGIGFFSTGWNKTVDYSADGITWTTVLTVSKFSGLVQCEDCCVALESGGTTGYYTKNGTTWTSFTIPHSDGGRKSQRSLLKRDGKYYLTAGSYVYVTADDFKTFTEISFQYNDGVVFVENCMNDWGVPLVVSGINVNAGMTIYALDSTDTPQQLYSGLGSYPVFPITADGKLILPYAYNALEVMYADVTVQLLATIGADTYPLVRDSAKDVEF